MEHLLDRMATDLKLRRYKSTTVRKYLGCARAFAAYHRKPTHEMGVNEARAFLLHLATERKVSPATQHLYAAALKFLFNITLGRPEVSEAIPYPKVPQTLPKILSGTEVAALLDAMPSVKHRTIVLTAYGAGLRIDEVCSLQVGDIDSKRNLIHVREGKHGRDRYVMLSPRVLSTLRLYWRVERPASAILFPGKNPNKPISHETVRRALREAALHCKLSKHVTPHILRHSFATHLLELGTDLRVIQALLGHKSIRTTMHYAQVTQQHVQRIRSPVDVLGTTEAKRKLG